jgi:hypothetical protein
MDLKVFVTILLILVRVFLQKSIPPPVVDSTLANF